MPEPLTLAEFKTRLADRSARESLGIHLTDAEAREVIADDQQVAELYVQMRTSVSAPAETASVPPAPASTAESRPAGPFYRRPVVVVAAAAAAVVLVVAGVVAFNIFSEQARMQRYAEIIREDSRLSENFRALEGENLEASFNVNCAKAREGWSVVDEVEASSRNWEAVEEMSEVTRDQFIRNNVATFEAALELCG